MRNKKGFTLIELLAVIIILGILMIIAIPSVTTYISNSRRSSYIVTAKNVINAARTKVNEGKLGTYNPDATYFNNLDNIVPGLAKSFEHHYHFNISVIYKHDFMLNNYTQARNGKYYRYNYKIGDTYYCQDNIIISNGYVIDAYQEKEKYLVIDYFIVDFENRMVYPFDDKIIDSFPQSLGEITKIEVYNDKKDNMKYLFITSLENEILIGVNKYNQIELYYNDFNYEIGNNFLINSEHVKEVSLPNTKKIGKYFLCFDRNLEKIYAPNVSSFGGGSLLQSHNVLEMELPKLYDKEFILRRKKVKYDK